MCTPQSPVLDLDVPFPHGPEPYLDVSTPQGQELKLAMPIHHTGLSFTWTCLLHWSTEYWGLCCTWACLDSRSLSCSWACLHYRGLSCIRTCLHTGVWAYLEVSTLQKPVSFWSTGIGWSILLIEQSSRGAGWSSVKKVYKKLKKIPPWQIVLFSCTEVTYLPKFRFCFPD
jgi:hypothetical protein